MRIGPTLLVISGAGLIGWALYEIDDPYLTLVVGIVATIIGMVSFLPDVPKK